MRSRSARAAALSLAVSASVSACTSNPGYVTPPEDSAGTKDWGPLAVVSTDIGLGARIEGRILITDECVELDAKNHGRILLVWNAALTEWREADAGIAQRDPGGHQVVLHHGDAVALGGGFPAGGDAADSAAWLRRADWIAPPDPSCATGQVWLVSAAEPPGGAPDD